jgi:hypothetical protein
MPRFFTVAPFEHVMARAELCQAPSSIDSLKAQVSTPDKSPNRPLAWPALVADSTSTIRH